MTSNRPLLFELTKRKLARPQPGVSWLSRYGRARPFKYVSPSPPRPRPPPPPPPAAAAAAARREGTGRARKEGLKQPAGRAETEPNPFSHFWCKCRRYQVAIVQQPPTICYLPVPAAAAPAHLVPPSIASEQKNKQRKPSPPSKKPWHSQSRSLLGM